MANNPGISEVVDKNGVTADIEAKRFDGTRTVQMQGDVTATQTWNGDSNTPLTLNASIGAKKVTQDKIGDKAVGSGQMADGSVGLTQMAASAMTDTVSANNSKLVTSQGVNAAIAAATLNRGKDYGPLSVDEINAISETIPTGSTVYVKSLGASDAKVINDGYSDGTMASFSVDVGEDLKYYRSPDNSVHGWYSTEANVKVKQPANYAGGIAVDSAQDASSGSAGIEFIQSFKQDTNGNIRDIVKAQVDIVDSTSSTRTNAAATPNSVKSAYDLANTANTGLENKLDKTGDGKDVTVSFTEASARANIGTGEKLSVMFGKIKKWFTDLGTAAFKNVPASGNASSTEVVLGSDTRLSAGASAVQDVTVDGTSVVNSSKVAVVPNASTSAKGAVQLASSIGATVASENNKAATEKAVRDAINALDSNKTSTDGTNVQVKVTETDGKISAVNITADNTENKNNKVTAWSETTTDAHYPSEKLVKDGLDAKADADNVVAIVDAYVDRANIDTIGWYKIADRNFNSQFANNNSLFDMAANIFDNKFYGKLKICVRSETKGSYPVFKSIAFYSESGWPTNKFPIKFVSRGLVGACTLEVWVGITDKYRGISLTEVGTAGAGGATHKVWNYYKISTGAGESEPVNDETNHVRTVNVPVYQDQHNIDSPTNNNLVAMDANGLVKDSGVVVLPSTSTWDMTSDSKVPTAKAVQERLDSTIAKELKRYPFGIRINRTKSYGYRLFNVVFSTDQRASRTRVSGNLIVGTTNYSERIKFDLYISNAGLTNQNPVDIRLITTSNIGFSREARLAFKRPSDWSSGLDVYLIWNAEGTGESSNSVYGWELIQQEDVIGVVVKDENLTSALTGFELDTPRASAFVQGTDAKGTGSVPVYANKFGAIIPCTDTFVNDIAYVANQSGGGGNLNKTINGTTTSVLEFMTDSEAVAIWADAKTAAANAS